MRVKKVISGGQIGVDQMGLEVAQALSIPTGGTAPKGYRTHIGHQPALLQGYGLTEHSSPTYPPRTERNILDSDGTVLFGDTTSAGSALTLRLCIRLQRPAIVNPDHTLLLEWLDEHDIQVLNVAGNRFGPGVGTCKAVLMLALRPERVHD